MFGTISWQTFCRWLKDNQWTEEKLVLAQCCCFWMLLISRGLGLSGESQKWPIHHFSAYLWIFYISAPVVSTQLPTKSFRGFKIGWRGTKQRYDLDVMMSHGYLSNLKIDTLLVVSQVFLVNIDGRGQCFIVFLQQNQDVWSCQDLRLPIVRVSFYSELLIPMGDSTDDPFVKQS